MEGAFSVPLDVGIYAPHGEVHLAQPPRGVVRLLAVDGDFAQTATVCFDEFLELQEHAARPAAEIVDASENFD